MCREQLTGRPGRLRDNLGHDEGRRLETAVVQRHAREDAVTGDRCTQPSLIRTEHNEGRRLRGSTHSDEPIIRLEVATGCTLRRRVHEQPSTGAERSDRVRNAESSTGQGQGRRGERRRSDERGSSRHNRVTGCKVVVVDAAVRSKPGQIVRLTEAVSAVHLETKRNPTFTLHICQCSPRGSIERETCSDCRLEGAVRIDGCRPTPRVLAESVATEGLAREGTRPRLCKELHAFWVLSTHASTPVLRPWGVCAPA